MYRNIEHLLTTAGFWYTVEFFWLLKSMEMPLGAEIKVWRYMYILKCNKQIELTVPLKYMCTLIITRRILDYPINTASRASR